MKIFSKTNPKKTVLILALMAGVALFMLIAKNITMNSSSASLAKAESENQTNEKGEYKQYGNCNYYVNRIKAIKEDFMRDLNITSKEELANFLEELKNNPDKRKECEENKKFSGYDIKGLPSDLDDYEKAIKIVCDSENDSVKTIDSNIKIIKALISCLKNYNLPEDKIDDIWPGLKKQ